MRKLITVMLIVLFCFGCFSMGHAEETVQYHTQSGEIIDISVHAGVKLGMSKEEVYNLETLAGNTLYTSSNQSGKLVTSFDDVRELESFAFKGTVAGISDSIITYLFRMDTDTLYTVTYAFPLPKGAQSTAKERQDAFDSIEASYVKKYGEATASKASGTYWKPALIIKLDYGRNISSFTFKQPFVDYAHRVYYGSDNSVILIEHYMFSNLGGLDYVKYILYDAQSVENALTEIQEEQTAIDDDI